MLLADFSFLAGETLTPQEITDVVVLGVLNELSMDPDSLVGPLSPDDQKRLDFLERKLACLHAGRNEFLDETGGCQSGPRQQFAVEGGSKSVFRLRTNHTCRRLWDCASVYERLLFKISVAFVSSSKWAPGPGRDTYGLTQQESSTTR